MLDRDFYSRRADQERELGLAASTPSSAEAHRQLEAAYRDKLNSSPAKAVDDDGELRSKPAE